MAIDEVVGALGRGSGSASGVAMARLEAVLPDGSAFVRRTAGDDTTPRPARSIVTLQPGDVGRDVLLAFPDGDTAHPVVLGVLQGDPAQSPVLVQADGSRVAVRAGEELVLECGKASITLTRAGKILIRGAYVLSRSSGVNRIKGGSVQIN